MPQDPTQVTGKRVVAWFIDAIVFLVVYNLAGLLFGTAGKVTQRNFAGDADAAQRFCDAWTKTHNGFCLPSNGDVMAVESWTGSLWIFLALVVIFIVYQGLLGASLGKLAMGLRIVRADGSRAGIGPSAIRTLLWIIDAITCALPIVGGILIFATRGHRRVGDMAAGTYVVHHSQVGHPVILPGDPGWGTYAPGSFGQPGPYGRPGDPVAAPWSPPAPTGAPTPWAPPVGGPGGPPTPNGPGTAPPSPSSGTYEADVPIWDDARHAYIQYDSGRAEWLEFDDRSKEWKPISR